MLLNFNANSMLRKACTTNLLYTQKRTKSQLKIPPFFPQYFVLWFKLLDVTLRSLKLSKKTSANYTRAWALSKTNLFKIKFKNY